MVNIIKNTKKDSKKQHAKNIKIFLKKKKQKAKKKLEKDIKILLKKKKKKSISVIRDINKSYLSIYRRNYYLTHKN